MIAAVRSTVFRGQLRSQLRCFAYVPPTFSTPEKVAIIGSGSFGSAAALSVARNAARFDFCDSEVRMYTFEEEITVGDGVVSFPETEKLSRIINKKHENPKYLPGVKLPDNLVSCPDLLTACLDATLLIFVMPFQFLKPLLPTVRKVMDPEARGVSLIKEVHFDEETLGVKLISKQIQDGLSFKKETDGRDRKFPCGVLMGANIASEIANGDFSESTLATRFRVNEEGDDLNEKTRIVLNNTESFRVYSIRDVEGCEACGALKNVIAIGAGFVDGLGMGSNTKAALMRIGIQEMERFCNDFLDGVEPSTFSESCGMADLITTCVGGRNRKCGEIFAKAVINGAPLSWDSIEEDHLNGQRLRGVKTTKQVHELLQSQDLLRLYPLFSKIYSIAYDGEPVDSIIDGLYIPNEVIMTKNGSNRVEIEEVTTTA
ncbi:hypothetical protein TrVE_jg7738 [Triparma verrucosa]|uniref:Glycerol-3-phosphate dehydrogenase [NAD(+)] n=2 Tax=Triparma TaxID=722752 RepID=A0A9W7B537_9STRA|nr:hypothetical protein TrST_g8933 [Triparma strigata]GMH81937.1 hypothetical protein TrVE_jg7738 [Triparma verrucosa]